jgi:TRAP-type C4-dicarboxylate transport system substrate-binding protein
MWMQGENSTIMRKTSTHIVAVLLTCVLFLPLPSRGMAQVVIKLGTVAPEGSAWHDALLKIRQQWRDISHGEVELRIYAGGMLGGETEMVRKVQRQGLDAIAISGSGLPFIDSSVDCLNIPMLFASYEELDYVRNGIAAELEQRLAHKHFKLLSWAEGGWIYFFTKVPVRTPDDLRKLRLSTAAGYPEAEKLSKALGFQGGPTARNRYAHRPPDRSDRSHRRPSPVRPPRTQLPAGEIHDQPEIRAAERGDGHQRPSLGVHPSKLQIAFARSGQAGGQDTP